MRRLLTLVWALVLAVTVGLLSASPGLAKVTPPSASGKSIKTSPYVALGDSYTAPSIEPLVPGQGCGRSTVAYPHLVADRLGVADFVDASCSGADTRDFFTPQRPDVPPQLDAVTKRTRFVTMTIGGNDGDVFGTVLLSCLVASAQDRAQNGITGNPCQQQYGTSFQDQIRKSTYPNLVEALMAVRGKAPAASIAIIGYPSILPETGTAECYPTLPISLGDVPYLNDIQATLNGVVEKAAAETGARFIDMAEASEGRDACQAPDVRWIEPLVEPINAQPVHPNAAGQAGMAEELITQLRL